MVSIIADTGDNFYCLNMLDIFIYMRLPANMFMFLITLAAAVKPFIILVHA